MGLTVTGPRAESVDVGPTSISGTRLLGGCEGRVVGRVGNPLGAEGRLVGKAGKPAVLVGKRVVSVVCLDWMIVVVFGIRVERVERVVLSESELDRELDIPATSLGSVRGTAALDELRKLPGLLIPVATLVELSVTAGTEGMTVSEEKCVSPTGVGLIGDSPPSSAPAIGF
jgi:hypothetical protein